MILHRRGLIATGAAAAFSGLARHAAAQTAGEETYVNDVHGYGPLLREFLDEAGSSQPIPLVLSQHRRQQEQASPADRHPAGHEVAAARTPAAAYAADGRAAMGDGRAVAFNRKA